MESNPKLCPVCSGRGTVPEDLYHAPLPNDWEPGDLPPIREGCPETECHTCEGLGVIWSDSEAPLKDYDEEGNFSYVTTTGSRVFVTTPTYSISDIYDWDQAIEPLKPSLTLIDTDND